MPDSFLAVHEIALQLRINQQTVRNWIAEGRLPAVGVGRRVRVRQVDFERFLAAGAVGETARPNQDPATGNSAPTDAQDLLAQALRELVAIAATADRARAAASLMHSLRVGTE